MVNKRGQGLSINALILIVLGIFILITLIAGFTLGWSQLKSYLGFSGNNVDTIVDQCKSACDLEQQYAFCTQERILKIDNQELKGSCNLLSNIQDPNANGVKIYSVRYGFTPCSNLCQKVKCADYSLNGKSATEKVACDNSDLELPSDLFSTDPGSANKCCIVK